MLVTREIAIYQKDGDKHIESFEIDLSIDELVSILNVDTNEDPNVYMVYEINNEQYSQIQKIIPSLKEIDFDNVELFCECFQTE
ncbi:hypothetical protein [Flavobacterium sp. ZS1P14]|uniref:DUF7683 domain-containing protein n=1 Tax=Flavobacterium sp. ZS1P14 TaxID=3401729 RepID=UPI003AAA93D5